MIVAIDFETSAIPKHMPWHPESYASILCLVDSNLNKRTWVFEHNDSAPSSATAVAEIQEALDEADLVVAHNLKFEYHWLRSIGINIQNIKGYCTMIGEYLLMGQNPLNQSLAGLSTQYGLVDKMDIIKPYWDSGYETKEVPLDILIPYCEQDTINCMAIYQKQRKRISMNNMAKLIRLEMELTKVLADIEWNGMRVDVDKMASLSEDYAGQIAVATCDLTELYVKKMPEIEPILEHVNQSSGDQLSALLYGGVIKYPTTEHYTRVLKDGTVKDKSRKAEGVLNIPGIGFTGAQQTAKDGVYKTDVQTLNSLKARNKLQERVIGLIKDRSRLVKLKTTYFDGLREKAFKHGDRYYVHPNLNQNRTKTGRLSCTNPNSQNLPREGTGPAKLPFISRYID